MSTDRTEPAKHLAFINARLTHVRLASETATSAPAPPSKAPQQVQLRTETSSGFTMGLDSPEKPSVLVIGIVYKVSLIIPDTENKVAEYEAKYEAQFSLIEWTGFDDWTNMPQSALSPYLAFIHNIASRKAEETLLEMGVKGVTLPQPEKFDGNESQVSAN